MIQRRNRLCKKCRSCVRHFSGKLEDDSLVKCANDRCEYSEMWMDKALWNKLNVDDRERLELAMWDTLCHL